MLASLNGKYSLVPTAGPPALRCPTGTVSLISTAVLSCLLRKKRGASASLARILCVISLQLKTRGDPASSIGFRYWLAAITSPSVFRRLSRGMSNKSLRQRLGRGARRGGDG